MVLGNFCLDLAPLLNHINLYTCKITCCLLDCQEIFDKVLDQRIPPHQNLELTLDFITNYVLHGGTFLPYS